MASGAVEIAACGGKKAVFASSGMQVTVQPNCSTSIAPARRALKGIDALSLPELTEDDTRHKDKTNGDRPDHGERERSNEPKGSSSSGGSATNGGAHPHI